MARTFRGRVYGLSDHTTSNLACLSAVALGASILERHFTDRMDRQGPDIICSMDELTAGALIRDSRTVFSKRGEFLTTNNIWVKRPGKEGIPAEEYEQLLGKQAVVDIDNNIQLKWDMII